MSLPDRTNAASPNTVSGSRVPGDGPGFWQGVRMAPHDSHWQHWHEQYAEEDNSLTRRLSIVRCHIATWLERSAAADERRVLSLCAGDGRDVLSVLADRRPRSVSAVLVELDAGLARSARQRADDARLRAVEVRNADAGEAVASAGAVPADLVMLCGIFGNVNDDDVHRTVAAVPQLAASGATVIWTRSRRAPDLTPRIREWFADVGCEEVAFNAPADEIFSVGVHRFTKDPEPLDEGAVFFRFTTGVPST